MYHLKGSLLAIEEEQRNVNISARVQDLGAVINVLSDNIKITLAYAVMKWLDEIKNGTAKSLPPNTMISTIIDLIWFIADSEAEEAAAKDANNPKVMSK